MDTQKKIMYQDILLMPELKSRAIGELLENLPENVDREIRETYEQLFSQYIEKGHAIINSFFPEVEEDRKCTKLKPPPCPWPKGADRHILTLDNFTPILALRTDLNAYQISVSEVMEGQAENRLLFAYRIDELGVTFAKYTRQPSQFLPTEDCDCVLNISGLNVNLSQEFNYHFRLKLT